MKKLIIKSGYALYLGLSLGVSGIYFLDCRFWIISIPTILLVEVYKNSKY